MRFDRTGSLPRAVTRRMAKAFTIIEILIVLALFLVVTVVVYSFVGQTTEQTYRIEGGLTALQAARLKLIRISREVQEAHSLFFPATFGETSDGVGFIGATGDAVMFYAGTGKPAPSPPLTVAGGVRAEPLVLFRADLMTGKTERLLENVNHFRATLHPATPGKEPSCVTLHLSVLEKERGNDARHAQSLMTRVFLRNLERHFPER